MKSAPIGMSGGMNQPLAAHQPNDRADDVNERNSFGYAARRRRVSHGASLNNSNIERPAPVLRASPPDIRN